MIARDPRQPSEELLYHPRCLLRQRRSSPDAHRDQPHSRCPMFEDSLVESAALLRTHNRWPAVVSITAQLGVAALILTIPLLHPEVLPMPHILPATLMPPHAPLPPPTPIQLETQASAAASAPATPTPVRTSSLLRDLLHPTGPAVVAP